MFQRVPRFVEEINADMKARLELMFIILFRYMRKIKAEQLQKAADLAAKKVGPIVLKS